MIKLHKGFFDILALALLWGPSYLFIKIAESDIAPLTLVAVRVSLGVLLLYAVSQLRRISIWDSVRKHQKLWMHCFVIGFFATGLPFACFNYAILYIPTSLTALITGTTPIVTIILANLFLKDERLTWNRAIGVLVGLSGFCVLFLPSVLSALLGTDMDLDIKGILLSFIAASSYAVGMVYARKNIVKAPPLVAPILQLSSSLTYLIPLAFIFESPIPMLQAASTSSWLAVGGLAVLGTMLAFVVYYRIVAMQGATALSTVTYLLPVFSTILGMVFLKETVGLQFCVAAGLILCGVLIINGKFVRERELR